MHPHGKPLTDRHKEIIQWHKQQCIEAGIDDVSIHWSNLNDKLYCLYPFIFTWSILGDMQDGLGNWYASRYCFKTLEKAFIAFSEFDGTGKPKEFVREL